MRLNRIKFLATLIFCLLPCLTSLPAQADDPTWLYVTVDARVHLKDVEVSDAHPQEQRCYVSNVVALPPGEEDFTVKKRILTYFNDNVVDPAAKRGVVIDYYDQEMQIDGGSAIGPGSKAEAEAMRVKDIADHKERTNNVYSFNIDFGPAKGEATSQPKLIYRDKEQPNYEDAKSVQTTQPAPAAPDAPTTPATPTTALPTEPQILKSTFFLRADRMVRYWKQPDKDNYWSWVPIGEFYVLGPIGTGTRFAIDFTMPDGKPWTTVEVLCPELAPNAVGRIEIPGSDSHMDKRGILATGTFGYKIRLLNALSNTNQTMMSGKFTVAKFHKGNALPDFKNQFEYYVDQDWTLPIGYLWLDWLSEPTAPMLHVDMWFKGTGIDDTKIAAYVFHNGKQISSTKDSGTAASHEKLLTNESADTDPTWERWEFAWGNVRGWNTDTTGNNWDSTFFLSKNPGDYQIKVLRDGNLVRTAKFTVGADGKIVDNGIVAANKIGGIQMILPVQISGTSDGKWDAAAWKTQAFYGNPLHGFNAP